MARKRGTNGTKYMVKRRPFRVWDGEGRTFADGSHKLILLSNTDGEYIVNEDGLSTPECVRFLVKKRKPAANVWFSFGYDVNKIITDLPLHGGRFGTLEHLWTRGRTWWFGVFFKYIPRKFFTVKYQDNSFVSTDTFSFFQQSFLSACKKWGVDTTKIEEGKANRNVFAEWPIEKIIQYNFDELDCALQLLNKLAEAFETVRLTPQSWHGPGAIATRWLQRESMSVHYAKPPEKMIEPIAHAFFGGRIDCSLVGEVNAWQNDIISAYPKGLTDCISQAPIKWVHTYRTKFDDRHALYHVIWKVPVRSSWNPFPWRTKTGIVLYPYQGEGWYWGVEVLAAEQLFPGCITRVEAWFPQGERLFPFKEPIERDYLLRETIGKDTGPGIAVKLALNSLFGKCCQHVTSGKSKPRWQNFIWAGYTTAYTRSRILRAIKQLHPHNVLAIATDGLFSRIPLNPEPSQLGAWENKGRAPTLFVASGLYAVLGETQTVIKQRGMPGDINYGWVLREWGCTTDLNVKGANSMKSSFTSFVGMGKALATSRPHGVFLDEERIMQNVTFVGTSKRIPNPLQLLQKQRWIEYELLPRPRTENIISYPYKHRQEFDPREDQEE